MQTCVHFITQKETFITHVVDIYLHPNGEVSHSASGIIFWFTNAS